MSLHAFPYRKEGSWKRTKRVRDRFGNVRCRTCLEQDRGLADQNLDGGRVTRKQVPAPRVPTWRFVLECTDECSTL
jgi:hypothetical protein